MKILHFLFIKKNATISVFSRELAHKFPRPSRNRKNPWEFENFIGDPSSYTPGNLEIHFEIDPPGIGN